MPLMAGNQPTRPVHAILLHTGRLLLMQTIDKIILFNPAGGTVQEVEDPMIGPGQPYDTFCTGHSSTADGRIFMRGGLGSVDELYTTIYTPDAGVGTWETPFQELWPGNTQGVRRYYPTCTTRHDGTVMILEGQHGCPNSEEDNANVPVIYHPDILGTGAWEPLTSAEYRYLGSESCSLFPAPYSGWALGYYPLAFLAVDGSIVVTGASDENDDPCWPVSPGCALPMGKTRRLRPAQADWQDVVTANDPIDGGSAVMFRKNEILKCGSTGPVWFTLEPASTGVYSIQLTGQQTWTQLDSLAQPRRDSNYVVLPDGKVMAVGGRSAVGGTLDDFLHKPEIYDPYSDTWSTMNACMWFPRGHHSVAILLPSGAVFFGGGDGSFGCPPDLDSYQIYKPPYFFDENGDPADRPAIDASMSASTIFYEGSFSVTLSTDDAQEITKVRLIRPGCVTHAFDQNQRSMELEDFCVVAGSTSKLLVTAPANGYEAPPGYYMLFVAKADNGSLPSEAQWVRLIPGMRDNLIVSANPPGGITSPYLFYRDTLQTGTTASLSQGIGGDGTPDEGLISYAPIDVTFQDPATLTATDVGVSCTYTGTPTGSTPCPTVTDVSSLGGNAFAVSLSGAIPPGGCTRIRFGPASDVVLEYESLPGDVNWDGISNAQDADAIRLAIYNGQAAADPARYDINRDGSANTQDYLRLLQLLAGTNTTQAWNGVGLVGCDDCGEELGGGGGGGSAPLMAGGEAAETPESAEGAEAEWVDLVSYTWDACGEWGWSAADCQPLVDLVCEP